MRLRTKQFRPRRDRLRPHGLTVRWVLADGLEIIAERTFNALMRNYALSSANR